MAIDTDADKRFTKAVHEVVLPKLYLNLAENRLGEFLWSGLKALGNPEFWYRIGYPKDEDPQIIMGNASITASGSTMCDILYQQKVIASEGTAEERTFYKQKKLATILETSIEDNKKIAVIFDRDKPKEFNYGGVAPSTVNNEILDFIYVGAVERLIELNPASGQPRRTIEHTAFVHS